MYLPRHPANLNPNFCRVCGQTPWISVKLIKRVLPRKSILKQAKGIFCSNIRNYFLLAVAPGAMPWRSFDPNTTSPTETVFKCFYWNTTSIGTQLQWVQWLKVSHRHTKCVLLMNSRHIGRVAFYDQKAWFELVDVLGCQTSSMFDWI